MEHLHGFFKYFLKLSFCCHSILLQCVTMETRPSVPRHLMNVVLVPWCKNNGGPVFNISRRLDIDIDERKILPLFLITYTNSQHSM